MKLKNWFRVGFNSNCFVSLGRSVKLGWKLEIELEFVWIELKLKSDLESRFQLDFDSNSIKGGMRIENQKLNFELEFVSIQFSFYYLCFIIIIEQIEQWLLDLIWIETNLNQLRSIDEKVTENMKKSISVECVAFKWPFNGNGWLQLRSSWLLTSFWNLFEFDRMGNGLL